MTAPESAPVGDVEAALAEARATNDRLNRRVQIAEAAVHELTTGTGNGKARPVAAEMWARCQETHERHCPRAERAEAALADLRARVKALADEMDGPQSPLHIMSAADLLLALLDTEATP